MTCNLAEKNLFFFGNGDEEKKAGERASELILSKFSSTKKQRERARYRAWSLGEGFYKFGIMGNERESFLVGFFICFVCKISVF